MMQPIRKVQTATHFKWVDAPARDDPSTTRRYLTPCSPGDADAFEKTWIDVAADELLEPPLTVKDFLKSVQSSRPTVSEKDMIAHQEFTEEFGQEG